MTNRFERAIVLFSGGQDSATCLAWALDRYAHVETIGFDYGQVHAVELQAREAVRDGITDLNADWQRRLGDDHLVDLRGYGALADSALTRDQEIAWGERGSPTTFVPGRNLVFLSVASALADRRGAGVLVTGVCETDYSGYPDCRQQTITAMQQALSLGLDHEMRIETPLMHIDKAETWQLAATLGGSALVEIIRQKTRTCYRGDETPQAWGHGCGTCPACELRAKGWQQFAKQAAS